MPCKLAHHLLAAVALSAVAAIPAAAQPPAPPCEDLAQCVRTAENWLPFTLAAMPGQAGQDPNGWLAIKRYNRTDEHMSLGSGYQVLWASPPSMGDTDFGYMTGPPNWRLKVWDQLYDAGLSGDGVAQHGFTVMARYSRLPEAPGKHILFSLTFVDNDTRPGAKDSGYVAVGVLVTPEEPPQLFLRRPDYDPFSPSSPRQVYGGYYDVPLWDPVPPALHPRPKPQTFTIALRFQQDGKLRVDGFSNTAPVDASASAAFSTLQDLGWPVAALPNSTRRLQPFSAQALWLGEPDWAAEKRDGKITPTADGLSRLQVFSTELSSAQIAANGFWNLRALAPGDVRTPFQFLPCNTGQPFVKNGGPPPRRVTLAACPPRGFAFADRTALATYPDATIKSYEGHALMADLDPRSDCGFRLTTGNGGPREAHFRLQGMEGPVEPFRYGYLILNGNGCALTVDPTGELILTEVAAIRPSRIFAIQRVSGSPERWEIFNYGGGQQLVYDPRTGRIKAAAPETAGNFAPVRLAPLNESPPASPTAAR